MYSYPSTDGCGFGGSVKIILLSNRQLDTSGAISYKNFSAIQLAFQFRTNLVISPVID